MYLEEIYMPLGAIFILLTFNLLKMMIEATFTWWHLSVQLWIAMPNTDDIHSCSLIVWKTRLQIYTFNNSGESYALKMGLVLIYL